MRCLLVPTLLMAPAAFAQDADGDGVPDAADNCPTVANGAAEDNQADSNGDGAGDACAHRTADAGDQAFGGQYLGAKARITGAATFGAGSTIGRRAVVGGGTYGSVAIARAVTVGSGSNFGDVTLGYGSVVGDSVTLGTGTTVANLASVGDNAVLTGSNRVGRGATVYGSASSGAAAPTLTDAKVGPGATVHAGATLAANARLRRGAVVWGNGGSIGAGAVIGRDVTIGEGVTVNPGVAIRSGATVHSGETVTSDVPRGAVVGTPNQPRVAASAGGDLSDMGTVPLCSSNGHDFYVSVDGAGAVGVEDDYIHVGVTPVNINSTTTGPYLTVVVRRTSGAPLPFQTSTPYFAYDFGGGQEWSYAVTLFDDNDLCYTPSNSAFPGNCDAPDAWPHFAGNLGNQNTEISIKKAWLGLGDEASGSFEFGAFVHSAPGGGLHYIDAACPGANWPGSTGPFDENAPGDDRPVWNGFVTVTFPTTLP